MAEQASCVGRKLSRQEISDDVTRLGWRYNLGLVRTSIRVGSFAQAAEVAQAVTALAGDSADGSLSADLRPDRVILTLQSRDEGWVTQREIELAERISAAVADRGLATEAEVGTGAPRSVQVVEIAIERGRHRRDPAVLEGRHGIRRRTRRRSRPRRRAG